MTTPDTCATCEHSKYWHDLKHGRWCNACERRKYDAVGALRGSPDDIDPAHPFKPPEEAVPGALEAAREALFVAWESDHYIHTVELDALIAAARAPGPVGGEACWCGCVEEHEPRETEWNPTGRGRYCPHPPEAPFTINNPDNVHSHRSLLALAIQLDHERLDYKQWLRAAEARALAPEPGGE